MHSGGEPTSPPNGVVTYRTIRELGKRSQRTFLAVREPSDQVVVQRFARVREAADAAKNVASSAGATLLPAEALAFLLRDSRCLAKGAHPNIARVRFVDLSPGGELTIATEIIEGTTLADLARAAAPGHLDPELLVRVLLDVLAGLEALHALRDGRNLPLAPIHGELCPANVIVGRDGVTRIVNTLRPRPVRLALGSEAIDYAAPEAIDGAGTEDARSDVYAVGAMLAEGLRAIPEGSPLSTLAAVAKRALSFDPSLRFGGPEEMAAELRAIAGKQLAAVRRPAPSVPATETPGDFVIPIEVTDTLNLAAPRQRRSLAAFALLGTLLLLAMGAFVASRRGAGIAFKTAPSPRAAAVAAAPPPATEGDANEPRVVDTAIATKPVVRASAATKASASAPRVGLGLGLAAPSAPRPSSVAAPAPLAEKPAKKSVYDPD